MRVGAHRGRIHEEISRLGEGFTLQALPEPLPDPTRLPPPEPHINGMPVAQLRRQVPPGVARAVEEEHGLQKLPLTQFPWGTGQRMLGGFHQRLQAFPNLIADDFAHVGFAHPKLPSPFRSSVQTIREHDLGRVHELRSILIAEDRRDAATPGRMDRPLGGGNPGCSVAELPRPGANFFHPSGMLRLRRACG